MLIFEPFAGALNPPATQQPRGPLAVDRTNPLARDLGFCLVLNDKIVTDLAGPSFDSAFGVVGLIEHPPTVIAAGNVNVVPTPYGLGMQFGAVGAGTRTNALDFGTYQPLTIPGYSANQDMTVLAIANPVYTSSYQQTLFSQRTQGGRQIDLIMNSSQSTGQATQNFAFFTSGNGVTTIGGLYDGLAVDGKFHAFVGRISGSNIDVFWDGNVATGATGGTSSQLVDSTQKLCVGGLADYAGNEYAADCAIVCVYAWNRALTDDEIRKVSLDPYAFIVPAGEQDLPALALTSANDNIAASITLGTLTAAAVATNPVSATAAITLGALTTTATAAAVDQASAAITLGALTAVATVSDTPSLVAAITLGSLTASATAVAKVSASAAITLGALTSTSAAAAVEAAAASVTLGALTLAATATVRASASAAVTLGALTSAAVVTDPAAATAANTLGPLTVTATAAAPLQASASVTLGALTVAATASNTPGLFAAITLGALTVAATATVKGAAAASVTLGALTTAAAAAAKASASANITLGSLTAAAQAAAQDNAASSVTLGQLTASSIVVNPAAAQANVTLGSLTAFATAIHTGAIPRRVDPAALLI